MNDNQAMIVRKYLLVSNEYNYCIDFRINQSQNYKILLLRRYMNNGYTTKNSTSDWIDKNIPITCSVDRHGTEWDVIIDHLLRYLSFEFKYITERPKNIHRINLAFIAEQKDDIIMLKFNEINWRQLGSHSQLYRAEYWIHYLDDQKLFTPEYDCYYNGVIVQTNPICYHKDITDYITFYHDKFSLITPVYKFVYSVVVDKIFEYYHPRILKNTQEVNTLPNSLWKIITEYCVCRVVKIEDT